MMRNVLLLHPQTRKTGNQTTIARLRDHFTSLGHHVVTASLDDGCLLLEKNDSTAFDVAVTIHAYKSAQLVQVLPNSIKLIVIFGGTDLNENAKDRDQCTVMKDVVKRSSCCVAFSGNMRELACELWSEYEAKVYVIHQGVSTNANLQFNLRSYLRSQCSYECLDRIILLVAGIRPVKDPLYLVQSFADSSLCNTNSFVILGPVLDEGYGQEFREALFRLREYNVLYAGELPIEDTHAAIQQSFCLVNSSISEGMSGALLEAFDLGVPVLARSITGNSYLIEHGQTGLLYSTPQEFLVQLEGLISSSCLREKLVSKAKAHLEDKFSLVRERKLYAELLGQL